MKHSIESALIRLPGKPKSMAIERTAEIRKAAAISLQLVQGVGCKLIAVASPSGGEGASVIAAALAQSLGVHTGNSIVLVDAVPEGAGDSAQDWLKARQTPLASLLHRADHESFSRLQGFPRERFPDSHDAHAFAAALRTACDVAVVVLPPLLTHPEALSLAARLDGVILVLEAERTRWEVAREAKNLLGSVGVRVLGAILNKRPRYIPQALYRRL